MRAQLDAGQSVVSIVVFWLREAPRLPFNPNPGLSYAPDDPAPGASELRVPEVGEERAALHFTALPRLLRPQPRPALPRPLATRPPQRSLPTMRTPTPKPPAPSR